MKAITDLKPYGFLLRELFRRDLGSRYAGSALGFFWAFFQPIWQLALFTFVFSSVLRIPLVGERTASFPLFLLSGLLPWLGFQEGVVRSASAILENANLVKKLRFPSVLCVVAVIGSALAHQAIGLLLFGAYLAITGHLAWAGLALIAPAALGQTLIALGLGLALAAIAVFARDTLHLVGIGFGAWFYLTPIVYPPALVPAALSPWLRANPMTAITGLYRAALLGGPPPPLVDILASLAIGACLLFLGAAIFTRLRRDFADEL